MTLTVLRKGNRFIAQEPYYMPDAPPGESRNVPKAAGFQWDAEARHWWTESLNVVELARMIAEGAHAVNWELVINPRPPGFGGR